MTEGYFEKSFHIDLTFSWGKIYLFQSGNHRIRRNEISGNGYIGPPKMISVSDSGKGRGRKEGGSGK